jgi:hypothetical protein
MNNIPNNRIPIFATERLQLAIYLHASERLAFSHCGIAANGKVRFVFEDPSANGSQAELEFDRGASVAASALFASQKFLRRKMSEILEDRRTEKPHGYTT